MKSIDLFEPGDQFRVKSTGQLRVVWKVSAPVLYIDSEGNAFMAEDVEQVECLHAGAHPVAPWVSGVMDCPVCGIYYEGELSEAEIEIRAEIAGRTAFTADMLSRSES